MYYGHEISDRTVALAEAAERDCLPIFKKIEENCMKCSAKVLRAFQDKIGRAHV